MLTVCVKLSGQGSRAQWGHTCSDLCTSRQGLNFSAVDLPVGSEQTPSLCATRYQMTSHWCGESGSHHSVGKEIRLT